jgi:hypothetical protein
VQTGGNVAQAARLLGVSRDTVRYGVQRYGSARPLPEPPPPSPSLYPPSSGISEPPAPGRARRDMHVQNQPMPSLHLTLDGRGSH